MAHVWSPVFTKAMFGMTNLRSALFRVPFLQFSLSPERAKSVPLQMKPGNQPPMMVLRPKPWKSFVSAWPPRDLSDADTCRTSRRGKTPSSRSCVPAARAAYLTRHCPHRLGPHRPILPSWFLVDLRTMWAAHDSTRHLRASRPKYTRIHP